MLQVKLFIITTLLLFYTLHLFAAEDAVDTSSGWKPYFGIPGADTASYYTFGNCKFFEYDDYIIAERELKGSEIGSDIFVKFRREKFTEVNCEKMSKICDMKVLNRWAEFFLAKKGKYCIVSSGTDERRDLYIYDMTTGSRIFKSDFSGPITFNYKGELSFWTETKKATAENCSSFEKWTRLGLTPIIETKVAFDVINSVLIRSTETRCAYKR